MGHVLKQEEMTGGTFVVQDSCKIHGQNVALMTIHHKAFVLLGTFKNKTAARKHSAKLQLGNYKFPIWVAPMYEALPYDPDAVEGKTEYATRAQQEMMDALVHQKTIDNDEFNGRISDFESELKVRETLAVHAGVPDPEHDLADPM